MSEVFLTPEQAISAGINPARFMGQRPVRGVDYWTSEDLSAISDDIDRKVQERADLIHEDVEEAHQVKGEVEGIADDVEEILQQVNSARADVAEIASDSREYVDRAEGAYTRIMGVELLVDVVGGNLCLYSSGFGSPIDIGLNGNSLEVYVL